MDSRVHFYQFAQVGMLSACAMVAIRWIWLSTRLSNIEAFMAQVVKLVQANNVDRALKLTHAVANEPVALGTGAVLRAWSAGRRMNETEVIDTFNGALFGRSVRAALGRFRALKTLSFVLVSGAVALRLYAFPVFGIELFWIAVGAWVLMFVSSAFKANRLEHDTYEAVGKLMQLVAEPDAADSGVDTGEGDQARGEGHLAIREAWEDADNRTGELTEAGVEALLLAVFRKEQGIDLGSDEMALKRIRDAAQKVVVELRSMQETQVNLPFITATAERGPLHLETTVNRKKALVFSRRNQEDKGAQSLSPTPSLAPSPFSFLAPSPSLAPAPSAEPSLSSPLSLSPSAEPSAAPPTTPTAPSGKAVVCRNCATPIPVEPGVLAQIEGEFDLWTKVKTRCPQCGGSFFELKK